MNFKNFAWTVGKLDKLRDEIDPRPQYQRSDAWDDRKRSLLIDSILNDFDIPKIYFRHTKGVGTHEYEVADGQQRLKAIWRFLEGELVLQGMSEQQEHLEGKIFQDLTTAEKGRVKKFGFIVAVVYNATTADIRELFRRLQLGVRLNPAELRNSMTSALGNTIRAMAMNHPFFESGAFSTARYKADDLVAHAFAIMIYKRKRDIKAPDLRDMYEEHRSKVDAELTEQVNEILNFMHQMQTHRAYCIATKWGFVDLVGVLAQRKLKGLDAAPLADAYVAWEAERVTKLARLPQLAAARAGTRDRKLFEYITAFQKEGATKKSLETRFRVLNTVIP